MYKISDTPPGMEFVNSLLALTNVYLCSFININQCNYQGISAQLILYLAARKKYDLIYVIFLKHLRIFLLIYKNYSKFSVRRILCKTKICLTRKDFQDPANMLDMRKKLSKVEYCLR